MLTKLSVHNLGVIKTAPLELSRPLTIVCGPNGSGKTYLSYIAYALCSPQIGPFYKMKEEDIKKLVEDGGTEIEYGEKDLLLFRKRRFAAVLNSLDEVFGIGEAQAKEVFPDFNLTSDESDEEFVNRVIAREFKVGFILGKSTFILSKKAGAKVLFLKCDNTEPYHTMDAEVLSFSLMSIVMQQLCSTGIYRPLMLPVERSSIYTFAREISNSRSRVLQTLRKLTSGEKSIDPSVITELVDGQSNIYPMALAHLLSISSDMSKMERKTGDFSELADSIEHDLLHGHLSVSENGDVVFTPEGTTQKLSMVLGASVVKTLSNLVFLMRHMLREGDLLIIDEPEINLHPRAQVLMARIIARLVNAGLRVMVSTHSDYMIREFNNLIMLGNKSEAMQALSSKLGYLPDMALKADDVTVEALSFDVEGRAEGRLLDVEPNGFEIDAMDLVNEELNEVSDEIYFTLMSGND